MNPTVRNVTPSEAEALIREGRVRILDVRTPEEFTGLGHIPGALLMPVDLIAVAPATLPREGKPWLVYCEHGIRSQQASRLLSLAGFPDVMNMSGGMSCWSGPRDHSPGNLSEPHGPSSWLIQSSTWLPRGGRALDVACGNGRHSLLLAAAGFEVTSVDRDPDMISHLQENAERIGLRVEARVLDLEQKGVDLGEGVFDIVLGINYLHRPLFPSLIRSLGAGGVIIYETFTVDQAEIGHPKNPLYLLQPGELRELLQGLEILSEREGVFEGRHISGVVARKTRG